MTEVILLKIQSFATDTTRLDVSIGELVRKTKLHAPLPGNKLALIRL